MQCPKCQYDNREGAKFCNECGYNLNSVLETPSDSFNKPKSYTPKHLADKILKSKSSIIGERKLVTVLFADVANYTSMSEKLDPEDIHQIMDGCFKILMDEIHEHKGTINQFTGDGVMAIFGAPLAIEDHAQDACLAALSIQKSIKAYSRVLEAKYSINFQMRIGINSGSVVVGSIGDDLRMDYTAVGDTTNLAARMESLAKPGAILVSPHTYKKVRQQFELKSLGETGVKGKDEPLEVYELIKDKVHRPRLGQERQIYSEMVGRDNDLNRLELQVNKCINGEGSAVNVIGEAGIGKSRLISELRKRPSMKQVTLLEGRAISIGRNLSFHPIIDLIKHWVKIGEDDTEVSSLAKLEAAIRGVSQEYANEIIPFVAILMGMKLTGRYAERVKGIEGEALEKLILKNVRDLIIKTTELTPLVIIIEDLHWADTSSIELLESLFRLAETQRVLFINVFRPDHKDTGERIVETLKEKLPVYYVEIKLEPLNEQMSEILIDNMLNIKGLHHGIKNKIVQRAGGNPFFIEEVVRSFIDEGAVIVMNGNFEVTDKIETMVIPHTINDVLMARIDRLEDGTRDLVKVASVIGRNFFHRILSEVAKSIQDIDNKLSHLKEIQLIRERKRMEELEYLFKHALAQEAAYESILIQKRKDLHLQVAQSIEKVFNERLHEFYGMLAYHYSQAENLDKTEEYLIKAGEEALKASASSEALHYCRQALELYLKKYGEKANPEKVAMLEKNIAMALFNKGQHAEAIEYFDKVLTFYGEMIPRHPIPVALKFTLGFFALLIGIYLPFLKWKKNPTKEDKEIISTFNIKLQALSGTDPKKFFIQSFFWVKRLTKFDITKINNGAAHIASMSVIFFGTGISFKLSKKILKFVKGKIDMSDMKSLLFYKFCTLVHNCLSGDWPEEIEFDNDLIDQNLRVGDFLFTSCYICWNSLLYTARGNLYKAQQAAQKLSDISDSYNNDFATTHRYFVKATLLMKRRSPQETIREAEEGIQFTWKTGFQVWLIYLHSIKARVQLMLGGESEAEETLRQADLIKSEVMTFPLHVGEFVLSRFILDLYKLEKAMQQADETTSSILQANAYRDGKEALKIANKQATIQTETLKLMGTYYWVIGRQRKAIHWWRKAIHNGQHLNNRMEITRTYFEVGKRLLEPASRYKTLNGLTAEKYLEKARAMFEEMDLQWDLDELDKVVASN